MITAARSTAVGTPESSSSCADLVRATAGAAESSASGTSGHEPAEVDEPAARRPSRAAVAERARGLAVGLLEVRACPSAWIR